jgi:hypothetical protein
LDPKINPNYGNIIENPYNPQDGNTIKPYKNKNLLESDIDKRFYNYFLNDENSYCIRSYSTKSDKSKSDLNDLKKNFDDQLYLKLNNF